MIVDSPILFKAMADVTGENAWRLEDVMGAALLAET